MKNNKRLYVDIHVLQTVPPSCVNRDDTGSPKTAVYGGVTRARVSSQSWKHAIRKMFKKEFVTENSGVRTKKIVEMISDEMKKLGGIPDPETAAQNILKNAGLNVKSAEKGIDALFFISTAQVRALAKLASENPDTAKEKASTKAKKEAEQALCNMPSIDIALFGRMAADNPILNTDACCQVAHSISTHRVSNEYDYFTAVDDLAPEDNAGAGHIGTVEFNSSALYRYATVAVHELHNYLKEDTADAVREFVRAFVCSMPDGKQNTFANRTLPDALLIAVRTDQPVNFAGAFEKPVTAGNEGYVIPSAKQLVSHVQNVYKDFAKEPEFSLVTGNLLSELGTAAPLEDVLSSLTKILKNHSGSPEDMQ